MAIGTCAAVLAGVIVASDESAPIPVRLDGFPIDWRWRSTDGTLPVRWNEKLFPWIEDESKIAELWKTRPIRSDPDWEGLALARSFDDPSPLSVKTCAEWAAGLDSGRGAMRTVDLIEQVEFIFADGILSMLAHAVPSARSTFTDIELVSLARELLPPPVDRDEIRRPDKPGLAWFIRGNRVHREDEDDWEWIEPVAFGDIDGDGWEDLVANSCEGSQLGSRFSCEVRAFTRRDEGELVEITPRVADRMPSSDERRRAVAGWRANYGLPVGSDHPIHLRGRCDCRDVDHPFEMYLTVQDSLLAGHYRCAHREKPLEIHGCLAESRGLIQEFGIDDRPTAFLRFDWRIVSGVLFLDGYRFGIGHQEIDNFKAEGVVTEASERMAYEGCASEVRFPVASGSMSIRRACGRSLGGPARDVLCVQEGETDVELVRFDRIEWISEERHPEEDPASDAELAAGMSRSVFRVDAGDTMALFEGWVYGGSTNNPKVIAIPILDGRLSWHERRIFDHAVVVVTDGVARIHERDLRAGVDPYVDSPQRPDVVHRWAGRSWEVEQ